MFYEETASYMDGTSLKMFKMHLHLCGNSDVIIHRA